MSFLGFNNFYMNTNYFGGYNPFMAAGGFAFNPDMQDYGFPMPMNTNSMFSNGMNFGYGMPSFPYNSNPSVFGFGSFNNSNSSIPSSGYDFSSAWKNFNANYKTPINSFGGFDMSSWDFLNSKSSNTTSKKTSDYGSYKKTVTNFKLDAAFINKTKDVAKKLNCNYEDLLAVMNSESGINPQAWNGTTAVGLIQFTNIALADLKKNYGINVTKQQVSEMSGIEQLDLVEKYLTLAKSYSYPKNAKLSAADLYAVVFAPGRANKDVLYTKGSDAYTQNPLDLDGDGSITKRDLAQHIEKKRVNIVA